MDYTSIAKTIIELRNADLALRNELLQNGELSEGYHNRMRELHDKNAAALNHIIDEIGYPTIDKVGEEASVAAWLVIQHAIAQPLFMKKCRSLLEKEVLKHQEDPTNLAYLTDRIALFEGAKQKYGTQFDWDENQELNPIPYDNLAKVNERRKLIGLNSLEEQIIFMRKRVAEEKQMPPKDFERRKKEAENWRKSVGWKTAKPEGY